MYADSMKKAVKNVFITIDLDPKINKNRARNTLNRTFLIVNKPIRRKSGRLIKGVKLNKNKLAG